MTHGCSMHACVDAWHDRHGCIRRHSYADTLLLGKAKFTQLCCSVLQCVAVCWLIAKSTHHRLEKVVHEGGSA